jgi:ribose-phosphate pyrophosphokinase
VEDALLKIFAAGVDDVFATDTLKSDVSTISVAPLVAGYLKKFE